MVLDIQQLILVGILCAAAHWLVARSAILEPLWSRATGKVDELLRCAGCSGFWLGLAAGAGGARPVITPASWPAAAPVLLTGLVAMLVTPVFEAVMLWGLERSSLPDLGEGFVSDEELQRIPTLPHTHEPMHTADLGNTGLRDHYKNNFPRSACHCVEQPCPCFCHEIRPPNPPPTPPR